MEDPEVVALLNWIVCSLAFLLVMAAIGGAIERTHLKSLAAREAAHADFPVSTLKKPPTISVGGKAPTLVSGTAVVSSDYFKNWIFSIRNVFGGESRLFTRLMDRARREATQRMIDEALRAGYTAICNVRYESADIAGTAATNGSKKTLKMAACTVTGTAYMKS